MGRDNPFQDRLDRFMASAEACRHQSFHGRPDFAWSKARVVVFVDGCFWHGHDCGKNVKPRTNAEAWREKIEGNQSRDRKNTRLLRRERWKVIRIWECHLAKSPERCVNRIRRALEKTTIERGR